MRSRGFATKGPVGAARSCQPCRPKSRLCWMWITLESLFSVQCPCLQATNVLSDLDRKYMNCTFQLHGCVCQHFSSFETRYLPVIFCMSMLCTTARSSTQLEACVTKSLHYISVMGWGEREDFLNLLAVEMESCLDEILRCKQHGSYRCRILYFYPILTAWHGIATLQHFWHSQSIEFLKKIFAQCGFWSYTCT